MRVFLSTLFVILSLPTLQAQNELFIGGDFGVEYISRDSVFTLHDQVQYELTPILGSKVNDNFLIGLVFGFGNTEVLDLPEHTLSNIERTFTAGILLRYRIPLAERFAFFGQFDYVRSNDYFTAVTPSFGNEKRLTKNILGQISIGCDYRLSHQWMFNLNWSLARYHSQNQKITLDSPGISVGTRSYERYEFVPTPRIAFFYFLERKPKVQDLNSDFVLSGQAKKFSFEAYTMPDLPNNMREYGIGIGRNSNKSTTWSIGLTRAKDGYIRKGKTNSRLLLGFYTLLRKTKQVYRNTDLFIDFKLQAMTRRSDEKQFDFDNSLLRLTSSMGIAYNINKRIAIRGAIAGAYFQTTFVNSEWISEDLQAYTLPDFLSFGFSVGI